MDPSTLASLQELIYQRTGLRQREGSSDKFTNLIRTRLHLLNFPSIKDYQRLLKGTGSAADAEVRHLKVALTTGETHFYRDRGQFELLEREILPALIEEKQSSRTLRI